MSLFNSVETWGRTTDPNQHDPNDYRYLVHVDTGYEAPNAYLPLQYFVQDLSRLTLPTYISTCLIDPYTRTFNHSTHGLILEVPLEGVLATSPTDMFTRYAGIEACLETYPIIDPGEILKQTKNFDNNEVIINPSLATVVGLFHLVGRLSGMYNRVLAMMK